MRISTSLAAGVLALSMGLGTSVSAEEVVVNARLTSWAPMVTFIQPGDSVRFANMTGHNTASIDSMIPEGAETWETDLGRDVSITFTEPGAYIYKCTPHVSQGMVGAIIVGDGLPANLDAIEAAPENKSTVARAVRKMKKALEKKGLM